MLGHGRPHAASATLAWMLAGLLCALSPAPVSAEEDVDIHVRITWGGGEARIWRGSFFLNQGHFEAPRRLGIEADLPGAHSIQGRTLRFWERTPTTFDGFDVRIRAPISSELTIQLSADAPSIPQTFDIPLRRFVEEQAYTFSESVEQLPNRVIVRRAPGDRLRVELDRENLVFEPGELFSVRLQPHHLAMPAGTSVRCRARLTDAAGQERWEQQVERVVDDRGGSDPVPLQLKLPDEEGVYTLVVGFGPRRFTDALVRGRLPMERRIQLVVISSQRQEAAGVNGSESAWEVVDEIDLSDPDWWENWSWLPQFALRSRGLPEPAGNDTLEQREHAGAQYLELGAGKWYAAPLPVARIGAPHILELEYPSDVTQTLGISLLEPNAAGVFTPLFLDSGVDVLRTTGVPPSGSEKHRLVFWPRTRTPWMLLTNRRSETTALFRRVRILSGPSDLPAGSRAEGERLVTAYYDKPWFPQNFLAREALENAPASPRSLNDWNTFWQGGQRLVQYLGYAGYNAAMISVYGDGSTLYPSEELQSTPFYDNGVFFVSGQDPVAKDVLEMLFRLFDREGLKLIPALHFATPLPELEERLDRFPDSADGIQLADASGEPWLTRHRPRRGLAPYYNPLDERVQAAVEAAIDEVLQRYGHHDSFAGVSLQLGPDSYLQLPDEQWPQDPRTWARFQAAGTPAGSDVIPLTPDQAQQGEARQAWLAWRAGELGRFHRQLAQQVAAARENARLYLLTADSLDSTAVQHEMRPRLLGDSDFADAMLRQGFSPQAYTDDPNVVFLHPRRLAPVLSLSAQASDVHLRRSEQVTEFYRAAGASGSLNLHETLPLNLPDFDANGPLEPRPMSTWLAAHIPAAGMHRRKHLLESFVTFDPSILVEGGRMLVLGQESASQSLFHAFRGLPQGPFETVEPGSSVARDGEVVVRRRVEGNKTYVYLVNRAAWSVDIVLDVELSPRGRVEQLDGRPVNPINRNGDQNLWHLALQPYDLRAFVFSEPKVVIRDWRTRAAKQVDAALATAFQDVNSRLKRLRQRTPMDVLTNHDFEQQDAREGLVGWTAAVRTGVSIGLHSGDAASGSRSLRLKVTPDRTVGWVRSEPFPVPSTGRISVLAFVRTASVQPQPPLRLAVDLLAGGRVVRYLYTPLGTDVDGRTLRPTGYRAAPLSLEWPENPFLFHIPELPLEGATELAVGFDLMGPGEVWIDNVQVFDLFFDDNEQDELLRGFAPAEFKLRRGKLVESQQYLEGFWPQFLLTHVPAPPPERVASLPAGPRQPAATAVSEPTQDAEKPASWRLIPQIPFRLPFSRE